ncbi:TetR family transcriptional regulator [Actinomycetes bacterium KLBMP 9797]
MSTDRGARRTGRPPLTERRRAQTRLAIAREAVRLFTAQGVAATSAEEIAAAAGISARTLWRYFPTKESCVLPLLTPGIEVAARALAGWPPGRDVTDFLDELERGGDVLSDVTSLLDLVRLTRTEPGLRAVWLQVHGDAEPVFAAALARRAGRPAGDLDIQVRAAMVNAALRVAVEHHAEHGATDLLATVRTALRTVADGLASP